eukprot:3938060-Rhodomonas_salina.1
MLKFDEKGKNVRPHNADFKLATLIQGIVMPQIIESGLGPEKLGPGTGTTRVPGYPPGQPSERWRETMLMGISRYDVTQPYRAVPGYQDRLGALGQRAMQYAAQYSCLVVHKSPYPSGSGSG